MKENSESKMETGKNQFESEQECAKLLTDLFEVKKVQKMVELDAKRKVNIGKLIKSVANCYECRVSKFDDHEVNSSDDASVETESEQDYYEVEMLNNNKIVITDKRFGKKHELNLTDFRNFLENKLEIKAESDSETGENNEESKEDLKFHFLKFELILREFYKKNEIRLNMRRNYNTNEVKKVDLVNLGFSAIKQPTLANTYQGKNHMASPQIKKNFFEDHKEEIKKIHNQRRKTAFLENNMFDKLRHDLDERKVPKSQVPKFNVSLEDPKEDKVSSFSSNVEESKDMKDNNQQKNSLKIAKRTSIFDAKLTFIVDEESDAEDDQKSVNSQD